MSRIDDLPEEIIEEIVSSVDPESITSLCSSNRLFAHYCIDHNSILWKLLLRRDFPGVILDIRFVGREPSSLKDLWYMLKNTEYWMDILRNSQLRGDPRNFNYAYLKGIDLQYSLFPNANFNNANLENAKIERGYLDRSNFNYANLKGASLNGTSLYGANFIEANCINCEFIDAYLEEANFSNAILINAIFIKANCSDCNFTNANLTNANLTNANLTNANLTEANFTDAYLVDANLNGVILTNTNLVNAVFMHDEGQDIDIEELSIIPP